MDKDGQYGGDAAAIVDDSYHLAYDFSSIAFECCRRESNLVAHELDRTARIWVCNECIDNAPSELLPPLLKDVSLITNE